MLRPNPNRPLPQTQEWYLSQEKYTAPAERERQCRTCGEVRAIEEFFFDATRKGGHKPDCKPCWVANRREYMRNYQIAHRSEASARKRLERDLKRG